MPCSQMEVRPYSYFRWCGYFWGPWVSFVTADEFSVRVTKLLQGLVSHELTLYLSVFKLFLTQWIMAILSKGCKPDNFESHNSLKLSFTNSWLLLPSLVSLPINWHSATRKHLFLYPQGDRSGLRKQKKYEHQH